MPETIGFIKDYDSAHSEPKAHSSINRTSLTTTITSGCTRCGVRNVVWRSCTTHNKREWLERVGAGGDHDLLERLRGAKANDDGTGRYQVHECP